MRDDDEGFSPGSTDPGAQQSGSNQETDRTSSSNTEEGGSEGSDSDTQDQWIERLREYRRELKATSDTERREELIEIIKEVEDGLVEKGLLDDSERGDYSVDPQSNHGEANKSGSKTEEETVQSTDNSNSASSSGTGSQDSPSQGQSRSKSETVEEGSEPNESGTESQDSDRTNDTAESETTENRDTPSEAETSGESSGIWDNDSTEDSITNQDPTEGDESPSETTDVASEDGRQQSGETNGQTAGPTDDHEEISDDDSQTTIETQEPDSDSSDGVDPESSTQSQEGGDPIEDSEATTEDDSSEDTDKTPDSAIDEGDPETSRETDQTLNIEALAAKVDDLEETFEEFKRSNSHEHQEIRKYSVESFAGNMLRVRDTLERAVELFEWESDKQARVEAIISQFDQQFTSGEIVAIDPERGVPFDYDRHEVVGREDAEQLNDDEIITVERKGFELGERVIRPAQVVIAT